MENYLYGIYKFIEDDWDEKNIYKIYTMFCKILEISTINILPKTILLIKLYISCKSAAYCGWNLVVPIKSYFKIYTLMLMDTFTII